jgi:hypothetical protein
MTPTNRFPAHTTPAGRNGRPSPPAAQQSSRRLRTGLISDAVVASYIHDISQRHRGAVHASEARPRRSAQYA